MVNDKQKTHDLHDFIQQLTDGINANYNQIRKRATEDPGNAGDQGEENWKELLQGWLPRNYEIVTKGRIISQCGQVGPQVDILVLKNTYPKQLIDRGQKLFLASGVAAAFECKITLTAAHIEKTVKNCVEIKNLYPQRAGTPYKELYAPIVYGLLSHSHSWKSPKSTPENNIIENLLNYDRSYVTHPRECLDLICVSDLNMWTHSKSAWKACNISDMMNPEFRYVVTQYKHSVFSKKCDPIGCLLSNLYRHLAWESHELMDMYWYFYNAGFVKGGLMYQRLWNPSEVYSKEVFDLIKSGELVPTIVNKNNEWQSHFNISS